MSALAAEASGVDLLYVAVPACHADVAKQCSLNVQAHPFIGDDLAKKDVAPLLELLATIDCAVIGPGIARTDASLRALKDLVAAAPCPLVLDASALQPWTFDCIAHKHAVLTPHAGEWERMGLSPVDFAAAAERCGVTILAKGVIDHIATPDGSVIDVTGGNPGLTVGGTGDALAGVIAGLIAQRMDPVDAAHLASQTIKRAGDELAKEYGYAYGTRRVIDRIPIVLHSLCLDCS
ncbi:MAG: NAD(P)HX epimerase / NAD(P)HX dehydratase [Candidatus Peregrinibacteria bacterium Gr01-1014_25]|nr:MAG: NAD(P)HX epimerase / NAD(P)HX dehydratase [Candidatus Peregrinibacteria bacterium Gr01-1014_25]